MRCVFAAGTLLRVCLFVFLMEPQNASAQQADSPSATSRGVAEDGESGRQANARRAARPPADIVADNLDRVATTADQILEILTREAGLMVEFKRLVAQDAGASGQILEESDLTDSAVTERLREELRSRVLATRLLQRYGYLLPKVNPDSELAAERNLAWQDRARQIARTERDTDSRQQIPPQQTANCDTGSIPDCELLEQGTSRGSL